jgi:hypothetical protein
MGLGMTLPVVVARWEMRSPTGAETSLLVTAGVLGAGGAAALVLGLRLPRKALMPSGVRAAVAANILFLGFCALELSDRLVRQEGRILYWTTFVFPPALVTFYGLVSAHRWEWWIFRVLTGVAALWFLAWLPLIPFADLRNDNGPVPWYGRLFMAGVTIAFACVSAGAFWSLGDRTARSYFGVGRQTECKVVSEASPGGP